MSATHPCPAPECSVLDVPNAQFACRTDWHRLPPAIRATIWRTRKLPITNDRRSDAVVAAISWYRGNPR